MLLLIIQSDDSPQQSCPLPGSTVTVGRNGDNDLVIDDPSVSGQHALLTPDEGAAWVVKDMNSSNGTRINGVQIREALVRSGDTITFGAVVCQLQESAESPPPLPTTSTRPTVPEPLPVTEVASPAPHPSTPAPPVTVATKKVSPLVLVGACGCGFLIFCLVGALFIGSVTSNLPSSSSGSGGFARDPVAQLRTEVTQALQVNRQNVFSSFHPAGSAKELRVHDLQVQWRPGTPQNKIEDVAAFTVIYTIFWEGPVIKDGYTKVQCTFDMDVGRYTSGQILATNGITNDDVLSGLFSLGLELSR